MKYGDIEFFIVRNHFGNRIFFAVMHFDNDFSRVFYNVIIRNDITVFVKKESGTCRLVNVVQTVCIYFHGRRIYHIENFGNA